jgi:hypothetical protein
MFKNNLNVLVLIATLVFLVKTSPVFAISPKLNIIKNSPITTYTDNYIQNLITSSFNKLIGQILPKDKLSALLNFSNQLTYDSSKQDLQLIYIPSTTDGSSTYFNTTNITDNSLTTNTAVVNTDLFVSGTAELQGNVSLGPTSAQNLTIGSAGQPMGITIYDKTTKQPVCVFSDNTVLQISPGTCSQ